MPADGVPTHVCRHHVPPVCLPLRSVLVQETRIAKLLVLLKTRLKPYLEGEHEAFREVQVRGRETERERQTRRDDAPTCKVRLHDSVFLDMATSPPDMTTMLACM